jgi:hypothetical protein
MDTLRQIEKDFQEISDASKKFINEHLEKKNIMYDMALCSELSGLMLLRAANKDISKYPPGTVIPGLINDEEYETLNKFMMGFAYSNKLNTKGFRKVKILGDAGNYIPEVAQYEKRFYEICDINKIIREHYPYVAATSALQLLTLAYRDRNYSAPQGQALITYHVFHGSRTVPYASNY